MNILMTFEKFSDEKMKEYESGDKGFRSYFSDSKHETIQHLKEWTIKRVKEIVPDRSRFFIDSYAKNSKLETYLLSFEIDEIFIHLNFSTDFRQLKFDVFDGILKEYIDDEVFSSSFEIFINRIDRILSKHSGPENVNIRRSKSGFNKFNL